MAIEITKESADSFLPLKATVGAVSALIKNCDQMSDNAENIKDIEQRVHSLYDVLASPVGEDDYAENARRVELRRKLDGIIIKLEPLSERHALLKFLRNVDNANILSGLLQELADAIMDYQVSLQQGAYTRDILGDTVLAKLEPVRNAGYQSGHRDRCFPGTRKSIIKDIMLWAKNPQDRSVFWLNGLAGTGKSAIAQSFSEAAAKEGILGASFFCSRDYLNRKELKNIFPTLAYQLASHYPHFRSYIISIIKEDPTLVHTSLISQLEKLLVTPLLRTKISCVIVIDGLDECIDREPSSAILSVIGQFSNRLPLVKFFVTGRPEQRIREGLKLPLLKPFTQIFLLHAVDLASVDNDILLFLTQKLSTIASQRSDLELPNPWPHDNEIKALTKKSSGLFIFAVTMVRFIGSGYQDPNQLLQLLLSEVDSTMHERSAGIDFLYSQILLHALLDIHKPEEFANIRHVLAAIVLAFNPLSQRELSTILGVPMSLISASLQHLHSVILVPSDETKKICIFHKSFPDYLQDNERCTNSRLYINPETYHGKMALSCLRLVKELKRNPCSLPPFTMNQDIDLLQLLENKIGGAIQYACTYWAEHLRLSPISGEFVGQIVDLATGMLHNAPPWIEIMSLENHLGEVIHSMNSLLDWLNRVILPPLLKPSSPGHTTLNDKVTTLRNFATDCFQLSIHFFHPIQLCAQQIYHTALPLSPTSSHLQNSCLQSVTDDQLSHVTAFIRAPDTWGLLLRTIDIRPRQLTYIVTSGQEIIAACGDIVNIYDAVAGTLQQSISVSETVTKIKTSPDGSTLFFVHSSSVTMWDIQTGGHIHTFTTQSEVNNIAISTSGNHIACGSLDGSVASWNIRTKKEGKSFRKGQPVVTICWLSPQELAVATQNYLYICSVTTGETLNTLPISGHVWGMVYFEDKDELLVGTSQPGQGDDQELCSFETISVDREQLVRWKVYRGKKSPTHSGRLVHPTIVGKEIVCIAPPSGVQSFSLESYNWTNRPPLLGMATSMAVSSNGNLVVQTNDTIQIFSARVLTGSEVHDDTSTSHIGANTFHDIRTSHIYSLGKEYILRVLQPSRDLTLFESRTLRELRPSDEPLPYGVCALLLADRTPYVHTSFYPGLVAKFDISAVMLAWKLGIPLPETTEVADNGARRPLYGLSPALTMIVKIDRQVLWVNNAKYGDTLGAICLGFHDLGSGEVYDITFGSETRFYLKIEGPRQHVQIPFDITASPSGQYSHTITKGEPVPLSEPREATPYTLDANCEWVLDAESRKICWISPGNLRRGDGGHFWAGRSLIMVGDDGVVREVSFRESDC